MNNKTTPYNPFDYLEGQDEIDAYLAEAFLDENPRVFLVALGFLAKKKGMSEVTKVATVLVPTWRPKQKVRHKIHAILYRHRTRRRDHRFWRRCARFSRMLLRRRHLG
ncbi:MAG: hypothetical protein LBD10_07420 [Desulfobulbus sp.]|jgi:hypothetical protein|uniref:helix-turn-helix domain-containing transcriptional regulator n=1 Tax=Desulfobulbus sp. TaxID=895 RepID=UPI00283D59C4|nr:hypothetical protein [Desulfobulbus sp.]MDR2550007.1 hypothetical protein [Desulfobulbus sp.]